MQNKKQDKLAGTLLSANCAIYIESNEGLLTVGCAFINPIENVFHIIQFKDDSQVPDLSTLLIQIQAKHIFLFCNQINIKTKIKKQCEEWGYELEELTKKNFEDSQLSGMLNAITQDSHYQNFLTLKKVQLSELNLAFKCMACLIQMCDLNTQANPALANSFRIEKYNTSTYMQLDQTAIVSLSILSRDLKFNDKSPKTLYGFLNQCKTQIGNKTLINWLTKPSLDINQVVNRQSIVMFLSENASVLDDIQKFLGAMPDLLKIYCLFQKHQIDTSKQYITLKQVLKVYFFIDTLQNLTRTLQELPENALFSQQYTVQLQNVLGSFVNFQNLLVHAFDFEKYQRDREYFLKPEYKEELRNIKDQLDVQEQEKNQLLQQVQEDFQARKNVRIVKHANHGWLFEISKTDGQQTFKDIEANQRITKHQYKRIDTKKLTITFTCKALVQIQQNITELERQYKQESQSFEAEVLNIASTYHPLIDQSLQTIKTLDVLAAFAKVVLQNNLVQVNVTQENKIMVYGLRHPCQEAILQQQAKSYIQNDIAMDHDESRMIIITGPNMGGKTTFIRSVAIAVLMNQIGCPIACNFHQGNQLPIMDKIITRVGAGDLANEGVSTFYSEMIEVSYLLKQATPKSLVIVDEIGRGTSSSEGYAITKEICYHLLQKNWSYTLFATHFHELIDSCQNQQGIKIYHTQAQVQIDQFGNEKVVMLYKVLEGESKQSYGINVMKEVGMAKEIISKAEQDLKILRGDYNSIRQNPQKMQRIITMRNQLLENKNCDKNLLMVQLYDVLFDLK